jgi:hypothetical protein
MSEPFLPLCAVVALIHALGTNVRSYLLTEAEKERFSHYVDNTEDSSLSSKILWPFWNAVARLVPQSVAPNLISLAGLLCTIQAFYLCFSYYDTSATLVSVVSIGLGERSPCVCCVGAHGTTQCSRIRPWMLSTAFRRARP